MKCYSKLFLIALLALAACFFVAGNRVLAQQEEEEETPYDDVEYGAYEAATKEADLAKRGTMLLQFIEKYPKSALMPHIDSGYLLLLKEAQAAKKWELLEILGDNWLKIHPNDVNALAFVYDAANNLKKYERCVECMEEIYKMQPTPSLAKDIFKGYRTIKNLPRQLEWFEKLDKMPEFGADYELRANFVSLYTESKNYPKAAEWAVRTLKSADLVKNPDAKTQEELRKIRRACNHVIGTDLMEKEQYQKAIPVFEKAIKAEQYGEGFYYIAQCQENLKQVDEAIISYAKAEIVGGESPELAPKAKARLETLYKALHNNTTIGIDKVYRKAKEELANNKSEAGSTTQPA